jgi:hypothetical protein
MKTGLCVLAGYSSPPDSAALDHLVETPVEVQTGATECDNSAD